MSDFKFDQFKISILSFLIVSCQIVVLALVAYIHTYIHILLMLPKWAFQLNRKKKKYKYIN